MLLRVAQTHRFEAGRRGVRRDRASVGNASSRLRPGDFGRVALHILCTHVSISFSHHDIELNCLTKPSLQCCNRLHVVCSR